MSDRTQIGPAVDAALWQQFREDVKARKGQVRGVLGDELEKAIRQYLKDGPTPTEQKLLDRMERIEEAVGASAADGGTHTSNASSHTHTPDGVCNSKPDPRAPTTDKVDWLTEQIIDDRSKDGAAGSVAINRDTLEETITDAYDFGERTLPKYKERIKERLDLWPHPDNDYILLGPEEYETVADEYPEK